MSNVFVADVHLGKLASLLRMLGFDTLYHNKFSSSQIVNIALQEQRILLTRSSNIKYQPSLQIFFISNEEPDKQLEQVINHFKLKNEIQPFTRCIVCNGVLERISKENILDKLEPNVILYFNEFWQCNNCYRIYWKGSHYERMKEILSKYFH